MFAKNVAMNRYDGWENVRIVTVGIRSLRKLKHRNKKVALSEFNRQNR